MMPSPHPSLLLFFPAHRQALAYAARHSGTAAMILRALVAGSRPQYRRNVHWCMMLDLTWRAYLLAPVPPLVLPAAVRPGESVQSKTNREGETA